MSGVGGSERRWVTRLLLVLAMGALLGRLGPFDTFSEIEGWPRYAYWIGLTFLMWLQGLAALALVGAPLAARGWPHWAAVVAAALLAAVPTGFEVAWAEMLLRVKRDLGPIDVLAIIGDVALLSVPLLLVTESVITPSPTVPAPVEPAGGRAGLSLHMDPNRRGRLLCVASEDHYVRLTSDRGEQLLAMRFADALASLGPDEGLQVHRRWWVARDAVTAIARHGDGLELTLVNGARVPVSRSFVQAARRAWPGI